MDYEIRITDEAEKQFDEILNYLVLRKSNRQAAKHFIDDFEETMNMLAIVAGGLKLCDNPTLHRLGYHRMNFLTMDYFLLYRLEENTAVIDAVFHSLQDYENKMR